MTASTAPQAGLAYLQSQLAFIEPKVYQHKWPQIQYPMLVPVSADAGAWVPTIVHYSRTLTGKAEPVASRSTDFPKVSAERQQHHVSVELWGIGFDYTLSELQRAMMLNIDLPGQRAMDARFVAEREIERIFKCGNRDLGWDGFLWADRAVDKNGQLKEGRPNSTDAADTGSGSGEDRRFFANKNSQQILKDINDLMNGIYVNSKTTEIANVLCVPPSVFATLNSTYVPNTAETTMETIRKNNLWTATTQKPMMIFQVRGLEASGSEDLSNPGHYYGRALAYTIDPSVLRLHIPMPFMFLPLEQTGPMLYERPGIFNIGGLEIRRPGAIAYLDKISEPVARTDFQPA